MANSSMDKIYPLTGIDSFILALERHYKSNKSSSNTCSYIIDLDGILETDRLKRELQENEIVQWISKFYVSKLISKKRWRRDENSIISVSEIDDASEFSLDKSIAPLLRFGIQHLEGKKSRLVMSWHHLLMDGYGAVLLLKSLGKTLREVSYDANSSSKENKSLRKAIRAKLFLDSTSKGAISDFLQGKHDKGTPKLEIINFSEEEVSLLKEKAIACGAVYGLSTFYLSSVSIAMKNILANRGQKNINFWVPIPHDSRKKGANFPILGNNLTFLFYRIFEEHMVDLKSSIKSLNEQTIHQIKHDIPSSYISLMHYLKNIPSNLYYYWIKGPMGKSLSSFLLTVAAEHPETLKELFGLKITNAISLPPNMYPPGITFAFNTFEKRQQLAIQYYENVFSSNEIQGLIDEIKTLLIEK